MYNIILCDDNREYMEYLKAVIMKSGMEITQVTFNEFENGELLVSYLQQYDTKCDLLILDMQLPGIEGDEVAEIFRKRFPDTTLVFCSGIVKPTDRSFKVMAYRYLYKEYSDYKMISEMKEIVNRIIIHKAEPVIVVHNYFKQMQLKPSEILYIEIDRRGSKINVCPDVDLKELDGKLLSNEKISDLYEILKDFGFEYAHNSYIVNLKYVKKILSDELVFVKWKNKSCEQRLSVSRSKIKGLKMAFARELGNKY